MALITLVEVKLRLGIADSDTSRDDMISAMIIDIRDWLPDFLNNKFLNKNLFYNAGTISFSSITVSDSESGFLDAGFVTGMDIFIDDSDSNNGFYLLATAQAGSMTITSDTFTTEAAGDATPIIYQVLYPPGLKTPVANLIRWQMNQEVVQNIASEKIGDYSVSYASVDNWPSSIKAGLKPYRRVSFT